MTKDKDRAVKLNTSRMLPRYYVLKKGFHYEILDTTTGQTLDAETGKRTFPTQKAALAYVKASLVQYGSAVAPDEPSMADYAKARKRNQAQ